MNMKGWALVAVAIVVAVGLYLYFSPYQQCVRSLGERSGGYPAEMICAKAVGDG